jgi:hypothetical protein
MCGVYCSVWQLCVCEKGSMLTFSEHFLTPLNSRYFHHFLLRQSVRFTATHQHLSPILPSFPLRCYSWAVSCVTRRRSELLGGIVCNRWRRSTRASSAISLRFTDDAPMHRGRARRAPPVRGRAAPGGTLLSACGDGADRCTRSASKSSGGQPSVVHSGSLRGTRCRPHARWPRPALRGPQGARLCGPTPRLTRHGSVPA